MTAVVPARSLLSLLCENLRRLRIESVSCESQPYDAIVRPPSTGRQTPVT
jgi:hypothetical protein